MASYSDQIGRIARIMGNKGATPAAPVPTDPRQQTMMQQMGITNPLLQQFGQQIANLTGTDTRSAAQQVNAKVGQAMTGTAEDKLQAAQSLIKLGYIKEGGELLKLGQEEQLKAKERLRIQKVTETLQKQASGLGRDDLVERLAAGEDLESIKEELEKQQLASAADVSKRKAMTALARNYQKTDLISRISEGEFDDMATDDFRELVKGRDATQKLFVDQSGKQQTLLVDEQGKVFDEVNKKWMTPSDLGLTLSVVGRTAEDVAAERGLSAGDAGRRAMLDTSLMSMKKVDEILFGVDENGEVDYDKVNYEQLFAGSIGDGVPFTESRTMNAAMKEAFETKLRFETGAAAPETEVQRLLSRLAPKVWDSAETIKFKRQLIQTFLESAYTNMKGNPKAIVDSILEKADAFDGSAGKVLDVGNLSTEQLLAIAAGGAK
jgi:hypothetical protein